MDGFTDGQRFSKQQKGSLSSQPQPLRVLCAVQPSLLLCCTAAMIVVPAVCRPIPSDVCVVRSFYRLLLGKSDYVYNTAEFYSTTGKVLYSYYTGILIPLGLYRERIIWGALFHPALHSALQHQCCDSVLHSNRILILGSLRMYYTEPLLSNSTPESSRALKQGAAGRVFCAFSLFVERSCSCASRWKSRVDWSFRVSHTIGALNRCQPHS